MKLVPAMAVMAGITYIIRALPITVLTREIKSTFIKSFLYYIPYSVLSAMAFPAILYSTGDIKSAAVGSAAALVMGFFGQNLVATAIVAAAAAFVTGLI